MKNILAILICLLSLPTFAQEVYTFGDEVADFTLKNIDEKNVSLSDFEDAKAYIIVFTCNHCPFAVAYEDRLIELAEDMKKLGVEVIAINPNDPEIAPGDSFENMQKRAENKSFNFPYLFDEGQNIYPLFGATRTPQVYLLDSERKLRYYGAIDDNYEDASEVERHYLRDAVAALLAGKKIETPMTKAIGCSIKHKK